MAGKADVPFLLNASGLLPRVGMDAERRTGRQDVVMDVADDFLFGGILDDVLEIPCALAAMAGLLIELMFSGTKHFRCL